MGWLESGLDFHVSKDEEGVEGKSMVLVSNASLKAALTSATKALGMRVVSHARILGVDPYGTGGVEAAQNAIRTANQNQVEDAQGSFLQEVWRGHEQDRQGGAHAEWPARREVHGHAADEAFRANTRSLTWRLAMHECDPIHTCRVEPIVAWAEAVWDEQPDDADLYKAWRRWA